jgi:hypothetical protein
VILLDSTLKSLEVKLAGAITTNQLTWTVHYVDLDVSFAISAVSEGDGATNNTTAVTLIAAPASNHVRQVKYVSVYNADTVAATVTIQINNNGTARVLAKPTLQPGETLQYVSE